MCDEVTVCNISVVFWDTAVLWPFVRDFLSSTVAMPMNFINCIISYYFIILPAAVVLRVHHQL